MNKILVFFIFVSSLIGAQPLLELKAGYFFFTDSTMRHTYNRAGEDVQLAFSYPIRNNLQIYASAEYFYKYGYPANTGAKASFQCFPLNLGAKFSFFILSNISYYLAVGPRYAFARTQTNYPYVDKSLSQNGFGGFLSTGFLFQPTLHFSINLFGDYSYQVMKFHPTKANITSSSTQVGGFVFGGALGYNF